MTRPMRLTQDLVDRLPKSVDAEGPIREMNLPDDFHADQVAQILSALPEDGALWVFAAGSLIWNPRCPVVERRVARVVGWHRAFCFGPMLRKRGNPDAPGRMMSLDKGGSCDGIAMRLEPNGIADSLEALLKTEPPLPVAWVTAETGDGPIRAIAFVARPEFWAYQPEVSDADTADVLARSVGTEGTMAEYLLNTVEHLQDAGIHDPHLWRLQEMVAERLEKLPR